MYRSLASCLLLSSLLFACGAKHGADAASKKATANHEEESSDDEASDSSEPSASGSPAEGAGAPSAAAPQDAGASQPAAAGSSTSFAWELIGVDHGGGVDGDPLDCDATCDASRVGKVKACHRGHNDHDLYRCVPTH